MTANKWIPLHIFEAITNQFSVDSIIGRGGYGVVYKGVRDGRQLAIKLLNVENEQGINDGQFKNEVGNLLRVEHTNIVQFIGYCYETKSMHVEHNGANDFSIRIYRVLCFEYLQNGSLDKHLSDKSFAPNWSTRYNIIKGICEGLNFLHECEPQILHLDLKPANILLHGSMEPKVADFGLSRLFTQPDTHVTKKIIGSRKYMPPEYLNEGKISPKNDVFSLGIVMIEIMTAPAGDSSSVEVGNLDVSQLTQQVLTKWGTVIENTSTYRSQKHQVKTCIELAIRCVDSQRDKRPSVADILDILNTTETHMPKRVKRQLEDELPFPTGGPRNTDNTFKTLIDELENITNEHKHCNSIPRDSFNNNVHQATDNRETTSNVNQALIIGRTEEKQIIMDTLSRSSTPKFTVLPIYGIGGIGKTTLAQLIYNDSQFADHFQAWVYVSQNLDLKKIGNSIISQLSGKVDNPVTEMQIIQKRLNMLLSGKKILIVLDDVWEKNPYKVQNLIDMLRLGAGSTVKIIVTTRDQAIAKEICHNVEPYKLKPFSKEDCWKIIKQKSVFKRRDDKKHLKRIGKDIALKCGGVALAAQSLGYMLKRKSYDYWKSVSDSYIWNLSTSHGLSSRNDEVLASLLLSYTHMPDWLKLCFSYCAVFPKGHLIEKYGLIHQWIALGFTEQSSTFDPMQLCEEYITQLLEMSFLQNTKRQPSGVQWQPNDYVTFFTMHDLVHDLARALLAHQFSEKGNHAGDRCRYTLLTDCSKPLQLSVTSPSNIKALHFVDCGNLKLRGDAFSPAIRLRVLDLSECFKLTLPDSIGQLKQLRYLCAPGIQNHLIPECITELSELSYLNLRESRISALPESIGDMKGMMHLDLSDCYGICELPVSFAELKQLVHLDLSFSHVSITEAFGGFTKLQYLNLCALAPRSFCDHTGPSKVIGNLINLRYLNLGSCMKYMAPSADQRVSLLVSVSTLFNLEHLDLSYNRFSMIPESFGDLKKLHTLNIFYCEDIEKLPDSMVNMVNLKFLKHSNGLNTSALSLSDVVSLPHFVVHASSSDQCSSNIIKLQDTNPTELLIDKLENVKCANEVWSIKLTKKQKIRKIGFMWTPSAQRIVYDKEVLEKLVPPSSVGVLSISGYMSANFPDWVMGIGKLLPNLRKIDLCDIPNCTNLPPLGQLPNLLYLRLCRVEGLEEWNTAYTNSEEGANELLFPELEILRISNCSKLRIKPCLPRANSLFIENCDNVLSSWEEIPSHGGASSSSPVTLCVSYSRLPLYQWRLLHHLPALGHLGISQCIDLTGSREIIKKLSSLRKLTLADKGYMWKAELPSWLVELTSLKNLVLLSNLGWCCEGVMSVPDIIQKLTNLEKLRIIGCPTLTEWYKSEENQMKLSHIKRVDIQSDWNEEIVWESDSELSEEDIQSDWNEEIDDDDAVSCRLSDSSMDLSEGEGDPDSPLLRSRNSVPT